MLSNLSVLSIALYLIHRKPMDLTIIPLRIFRYLSGLPLARWIYHRLKYAPGSSRLDAIFMPISIDSTPDCINIIQETYPRNFVQTGRFLPQTNSPDKVDGESANFVLQ